MTFRIKLGDTRSSSVMIVFTTLLMAFVVFPATAHAERCFLAYEGYVPFERPDGPKVLGKRSSFMQEFEYDKNEALQAENGKIFQKLFTGAGPFGYVDDDFIVKGNTAVKVVQKTESGKELKTEIFKKVRLSNSYSYLRETGENVNKDDVVTVPAYSAPLSAPNRIIKRHQLAAMRFVYKELKDYVLIGRLFSFDNTLGTTAREVVTGWVPKNRTIKWDTRLAIEWNYENASRRILPAMLFSEYIPDEADPKAEVLGIEETEARMVEFVRSQSALENEISRLRIDNETTRLLSRLAGATGSVKRQLESDINKRDSDQAAAIDTLLSEKFEQWHIPVSEPVVVKNGVMSFQRLEPTDHSSRMPVEDPYTFESVQLANYWGFVVGGNAGFSGTISNADHKQLQEKLTKIQESLNNIDVQLVIDATSTMRSYITAAVAAMTQVAMDLEAGDGASVRFAVTFYRDKTWYEQNQPKNPKQIPWAEVHDYVDLPVEDLRKPLVRKRLAELIEALSEETRNNRNLQAATRLCFRRLLQESNHPFFRLLERAYQTEASSGGNPQESVFAGLEHAVMETDNYRNNSLSQIILIGDSGDNGDSRLSETEIVNDILAPEQVAPSFLSVIDVRNQRELHRALSGIVEKVNERINGEHMSGDPAYTRIGQTVVETRPADVAIAINTQLSDARAHMQQTLREINQLLSEGYGGSLTSFSRKVLSNQGVDVASLSKIEGAEVFRRSLLPYLSGKGKSCVRQNVLISNGELDRLIGVLKPIGGHEIRDKGIAEGRSLKTLFKRAVEGLLGNEDQSISFSEALRTLTGLPARTGIMKLESDEEWEEFLEQRSDPTEEKARRENLETEIERLTIVYYKLLDVKLNRYRRYEWKDLEPENPDDFPKRQLISHPENPFSENPNATVKRDFKYDTNGVTYYWLDAETEYP